MWSSDPNLTKLIVPNPPYVVSLTEETARENGMVPYWNSADAIGPPGEEVELSAKYNWDDPRWPKGYPDDPGVVSRMTPMQRVKQGVWRPLSRQDPRPRF